MAVNVAVDSLCDAIVAKLETELVPTAGAPVTATKPAYLAQRYTGGAFKVDEAFRRGIAGRTPALLVRHAGSKSIRTTIGRRVDRVESKFDVIVCTDAQTEKDRRSAIFDLAESVRDVIGARAFSLPINPMRWQSTDTLHDSDSMLAIGVSFTTKHRVDYTVDPGTDTMDSATGDIVAGEPAWQPTITPTGTEGVITYGYKIVPIDEDGARLLISTEGRTDTGNATLDGTNYNALEWEEVATAASYEIHRTYSDGTPATLGLIGTTADLSFNDTGLAPSETTPTTPFTQEIEVDLT